MHLIELRSGREGHPTYRAVAQAMHERIAAIHPGVAAAMSYVDTSQEPRLERIMSEIRTQRKRAQAAQAAGADSPPGLNSLAARRPQHRAACASRARSGAGIGSAGSEPVAELGGLRVRPPLSRRRRPGIGFARRPGGRAAAGHRPSSRRPR